MSLADVETWTDERDITWRAPTAWAYAQVCRARREQQERADRLLAALREIRDMTNEDTGTFRKRGGTYRGLVGVIADKAINDELQRRTA